MGCIFSKTGQVKTLTDDIEEPLPASAFSTRGAAHAWLQEIGLPQYAEAFENAGFSDWDLLSCLTETDLEAITTHTDTAIPPGHRKKLLMASRQMGTAAAQGALGAPPPYGSARRYSHTSNTGNGNGSRGGGLTAAVAAALDRRSNGLRPCSTSRVPSLASIYAGNAGLGHPPQQLPLLNVQSRNATEDGLVSGRRSRGVGIMVPSSNSSRNSLSAVVGHAIGYIASPSITAPQEGGGGQCDTWVAADGRRSPTEPASPTSSAATPAGPSGPTPPRQRRRWSANKHAPRGVLVGGNSAGGVPFSASPYGWVEPEAGGLAMMSSAGPITNDVRQLSVVSSICDASDVGAGGISGGILLQACISRDLESLVMGASDATNRVQASRSQSLAATRPDRSYGGGGGGNVGGRPSPLPPPHRVSGGQAGHVTSSGGGGGGLQASPTPLADSPYTRGSLHLTGAAQETQQQQGLASHQSVSQPNLDGYGQQQTQSKQPRIASARDGAAAASATTASAFGTSVQPSSPQRPGSAAADSTLRPWANAAPLPPLPTRPSTGSNVTLGNATPTPAGVPWASQDEAVSNSAAAVTCTDGTWSVDRDSGLPGSSNVPSKGSPSGALPRFVHAITGWAIPTHGGGAVGARSDAAVCSSGASAHPAPSVSSQRRGYTQQSVPQPQLTRPRSRSVLAAGKVPGPAPDTDRPVAGDVLSAAAAPSAAGLAPRESASAEPFLRKGPDRGRSQRPMMAPDVYTPRGPWNQDAALCIQGRGYKPASPMLPGHGPGMRVAAAVVLAGGSSAAGDEDSDAASSASHHANGVPVPGAASSAARGGRWPFVMPQLPQPIRLAHNDAAGMHPPAYSAVRAPGSGSCGGESSISGVRFSTPSILATPSESAAAEELVFATGSANEQAVASGAIPQVGRVHERLSSMLLESLTSDASAATTVRRGPQMQPRDWCPSTGGGSEDPAAEHSGVNPSELSADDLVLRGSPALRPHRIQNMYPSLAAVTACDSAGAGRASLHSGIGAATVTHWPAMPLQPPTRSRPPQSPHGAAMGGGGGAGDVCQRMEVLPPEAPGPIRVGAVPPGTSAAGGGPPRPTPGRKLDLEMLAEQVGRIMSHLSYIAKEGADSEVDMSVGETQPAAGTTAAVAVAATAVNNGGGKDGSANGRCDSSRGKSAEPVGGRARCPVPDAVVTAAPGSTDTGGASLARTGSRRQAIDQKRLELQRLHVDLVRRVAAMEVDPQPPPPPESAAGGYDGASLASAAQDMSAADALSEVEARIRTKLAELAALTMRPASERRAARCGDAAAPVSASADDGGGNSGLSGGARKRTLGSDTGTHGGPACWDIGNRHGVGVGGPGYGHRRAHEEAALHMEVLAALGARKRQVRGAAALEPGYPSGNGSEEDSQLRQPHRPRTGQDFRRAVLQQQHPPAAAPNRSGATTEDQQSGAGAGGACESAPPMMELQDSLRAELLAIDNKIKARLRGSGSSRRA